MSSRRSAARVSATILACAKRKPVIALAPGKLAGQQGTDAVPARAGSGSRPDRIGERGQAAPDVGVQSDGDVVVRIHLGGKPVQVADLVIAGPWIRTGWNSCSSYPTAMIRSARSKPKLT